MQCNDVEQDKKTSVYVHIIHSIGDGIQTCYASRSVSSEPESISITSDFAAGSGSEEVIMRGLEAGEEPGALEKSTKDDMNTVSMDPSMIASSIPGADLKLSLERASSSLDTNTATNGEQDGITTHPMTSTLDVSNTNEAEEDVIIRPYSLPAISHREL